MTNPAAVECREPPLQEVRPLRGRELCWSNPDPWDAPTANDIVPLRGTH